MTIDALAVSRPCSVLNVSTSGTSEQGAEVDGVLKKFKKRGGTKFWMNNDNRKRGGRQIK